MVFRVKNPSKDPLQCLWWRCLALQGHVGEPERLLPLQLPLRLLLPHSRLLLRSLLVLLLLPPALRQPPQAASPPVAQPEQEGDPPLDHLLPQRELYGPAAEHREGDAAFSEGSRQLEVSEGLHSSHSGRRNVGVPIDGQHPRELGHLAHLNPAVWQECEELQEGS